VDRVAELYKTYGGFIYARCRRILADSSAAEDATQETFVRVYRHLDRAPNSDEALRWIYRIATNYCLNELRDRRLRPEIREEIEVRAGGNLEEQLVDRHLLSRLLARAPEKLTSVAWLVYGDGMTHDEVAQTLGITRRTVINRAQAFSDFARKLAAR
jgi:RNA polymerase sigma-70 factor, ECF subfamily